MDHEVLERIIDGKQKPADLPFALLKDITENFSDNREIGHGGFAMVYRGVLRNGKTIAVKRIKSNHSINETLFRREVDTLLNIEHENVVRFLGFCASTNQIAIKIEGLKEHIYAEVRERLLCFEYIRNGSLQEYITDELRGLEWNTRYEIIRGICEGLYHLHNEKQIYHMDMKPDNILLDNDMMPKITDFGLSRLDEKSQTMSEERLGSRGYCAPEYLCEGKMSFKSDMYSLGVIIIELVTGQKALANKNNNALRRWRHRWKITGMETQLAYQQVAKCLEIGLLCQEIEPSKRPYICQMIHDIREIDGPNEKTSNASEHTFDKISPYTEDDMLGIEPLKLHFPFELNKQMSCALWLTNETDSYIAFKVEKTSPLSYCTQPQIGIMPPQSKCNVDITLQLQGKAPGYMHRANELTVWSTKVNDCLTVEDITTNMFINEAVNVVDEVSLDVGFDAIELEEASKKSNELKQYQKGTALISIEHMPDLREISAKFGGAAADLEHVSRIGIVHNRSSNPTIDVQLVDSGSHGDKRISSISLESSSRLHVPGKESGAEAGGEQQCVVSWSKSNIIGVIGRDLFMYCLHRLSRWEYGAIASLNRDFNSVVRNGDIYRLRRKNGVAEHWLYLSCGNKPPEWEAYDPSTGRWIHVPKIPPAQSYYWESVAVGTELLVFGSGGAALRYSILTNSWTWLADAMNTPRYWFGSASVGEKAYVAGGADSSSEMVLSSAEMYDSETHTWTPLPSINRARCACSGAFMDGKFYVIGGSRGCEVLTCGEEYDLNRRSWRVIDNMSQGLNETIMGAPLLLAVVNSELYAADYRENNDLKQYDKLDNKWITLGKLPVRSKYKDGWDMGFRACGDRLIVIGPPNNSTDEKVVELHSWIPDEEPPVWNLVATQQFTSEGPFLYCAVMGC